MEKKRLWVSKAFVCCSNTIFMMSGFGLMSLGGLLLSDSKRVLLSRLLGESDIQPEQPLFYYLSFLLVGLGFIITLIGLLGCWATCLFGCCVTTIYVSMILVLLVGECALCVVAVFWSDLLGIDVKPSRLVRALQRSYTVPGREQFTAALDLAQTTFSCCGINGSNNYGTSWWRVQESGQRELVVPLTCCTLKNAYDENAYLNPNPKNLTLCQALNPSEHQKARNALGCLEPLESWLEDQALLLFAVGVVVFVVELSALFTTLIACSKLKKARKTKASAFTSTQTLTPFSENDHDYGSSIGVETRMQMSGMTFGAKS